MVYVDAFVIPVPKGSIDAYREVARQGGEVWKEYGALECVECVADDVPYGELTSFPRAVQCTEDEIVVFSWIVFASREARDAINQKVMSDQRLKDLMTSVSVDMNRMIFGGFVPIYGR